MFTAGGTLKTCQLFFQLIFPIFVLETVFVEVWKELELFPAELYDLYLWITTTYLLPPLSQLSSYIIFFTVCIYPLTRNARGELL